MIVNDNVRWYKILYSTVFFIILTRLRIMCKNKGTSITGLLPIIKILYTLNPVIWITGIIAMYVHHSIVKV